MSSPLFSREYPKHDEPHKIDNEFAAIETAFGLIVFAESAPKKNQPGRLWFYEDHANSRTRMYVKNTKTGDWYGPTDFS